MGDMKTKRCTKCNKEKLINCFSPNKSRKDRIQVWCKKCINNSKYVLRKKYPWKNTYQRIKERCTNIHNNDYKYYGGKGIKCLITEEEIKKLWFRGRAWLLEWPSIDRKENKGDYTYENCKYIEFSENAGKDKRKPVRQYDLEGIFIKEWISSASVYKHLKIQWTNISSVCLGKRKTAGGFIWKFATKV